MNFGLEVQVFLRQHKKIHSYVFRLPAGIQRSPADVYCHLQLVRFRKSNAYRTFSKLPHFQFPMLLGLDYCQNIKYIEFEPTTWYIGGAPGKVDVYQWMDRVYPPSSLHSAPYPSPKSQSYTPDLLPAAHHRKRRIPWANALSPRAC